MALLQDHPNFFMADMTNYYDPIYGQIQLEELVTDMISKCPELQRLRFIGMMNFKSLEMLPLTSINRLEHTIGVAYLVQLFVENNPYLRSNYHNLLVAALYHDINCGSFGHSVEWAIDQHVNFKHESDAEWVKDENTLSCLQNKPIYLEQDGLHRYNFKSKYHLDFSRIDKIINGDGYFYLNNIGIDLDNIDNVFRMAHYLGLLVKTELPVLLVRALRTSGKQTNFIIEKKDSYLIDEWYRLRTEVYQRFIYSNEYMGFEYLIFELIAQYASGLGRAEEVKSLFHYTDEKLLWSLYDMKQQDPRLANIAKRLLLHDLPQCYVILKSKTVPDHHTLRDRNTRQRLIGLIQSQINKAGLNGSLYLHMTTDDRKTSRRIDYYVDDSGRQYLTNIGEDRRYVLLSILGDRKIGNDIIGNITEAAIFVLNKEGLPGFEACDLLDKETYQENLF